MDQDLVKSLTGGQNAEDGKDVLTRSLRNPQSHMNPGHITSLPFDILALLCDYICEAPSIAGYLVVDHKRFQLVCRRFREAMLCLPRFWAFVDDRMPVDRMELQVRRCASTGSSIHMGFRIHQGRRMHVCKCSRWEFIKSHSEYWSFAIVQVDASAYRASHLNHSCLYVIHNLRLPFLTTLSTQLGMVNTKHLCWTHPRLENLCLKTDISIQHALDTLTVPAKRLVIAPEHVVISRRSLVLFMLHPLVANITELEIDVTLKSALQEGRTWYTSRSIPLHSLRSLSVHTGPEQPEDEHGCLNRWFAFMGRFECPNLVTLTFVLQICFDGECMGPFWRWIESIKEVARGKLRRVNVLVMDGRWNERRAALIKRITAAFAGADYDGEAPVIVIDKTVVPFCDRLSRNTFRTSTRHRRPMYTLGKGDTDF